MKFYLFILYSLYFYFNPVVQGRIFHNFVTAFGNLFETIDKFEEGSDMISDVLEFSDAYRQSQELISSCAILRSDVRSLVDHVGAVCYMIKFGLNVEKFMAALDQKDVDPSGERSVACADALSFCKFATSSYPMLAADGPCKVLNAKVFENFGSWLAAQKSFASTVLERLRQILSEFYGSQFDKPEDGWGDDMAHLDKLLQKLKSAISHAKNFECSGESESAFMQQLLSTAKDIEQTLDVGLTQEEKSLKESLSTTMQACLDEFPQMSKQDLLCLGCWFWSWMMSDWLLTVVDLASRI